MREKSSLTERDVPYVNDIVRAYFDKFGEKVGHTLMQKKRMKEIFLWAKTCENITQINLDKVNKWLLSNGK